jgi:hypothetical protein
MHEHFEEKDSNEAASFSVILKVLDASKVMANGKESDASCTTLEQSLYALAIDPVCAPMDSGYELTTDTCVTALGGDEYRLDVDAYLFNTGEFKRTARNNCELEKNASLNDMLYEMVLIANDAPSPDECGYEIGRRF